MIVGYKGLLIHLSQSQLNLITMAQDTKDWPELAIGLYDKLTGRNAEITYDFEDLEVFVPSSANGGATHAKWKLNGTVKIHTRERKN